MDHVYLWVVTRFFGSVFGLILVVPLYMSVCVNNLPRRQSLLFLLGGFVVLFHSSLPVPGSTDNMTSKGLEVLKTVGTDLLSPFQVLTSQHYCVLLWSLDLLVLLCVIFLRFFPPFSVTSRLPFYQLHVCTREEGGK